MKRLLKERQDEIDYKINEFLLQTSMSYPEDSLLDIAEAINIDVHLIDFKKIKGMEHVEGMISYGNPSTILLSKNKSKQRRLFTLAHELGHFMLHKPNLGGRFRLDTVHSNATEEERQEELEANYFSASLLVPAYKLVEILKATRNIPESLQYIADYFGVSKSMIGVRIRWLQQN